MSYVLQRLKAGELIVDQAPISWWSQSPLLLFGFLLLPMMGGGLLLLMVAVARYYSTEMTITNQRVIATFGVVVRHTVDISLDRIVSIEFEQNKLGRFFKFGSIILSGGDNLKTPIPGIENPSRFCRACAQSREKAAKAVVPMVTVPAAGTPSVEQVGRLDGVRVSQ